MFPRLFRYHLFTALMMLSLVCSSADGQEQTRFVLKLDSELLSNLRLAGALSSNVESQFRGRISMIEIQFEGGDPTAEAVEVDAGLEVGSDLATIEMSESLISQIQRHPIRINVPEGEREFSKISLDYQVNVPETQPAQGPDPILNDAGQPVEMNYIQLIGDELMSGGLDGFDEFKLDTRFGNISIPMNQVAGIKFHVDASGSAVVVLTNGDSVTGKPTIPAIRLNTDWGHADIEPKYIDSLTTSANAKFEQQSTDYGLRWKLKTGTSLAPGPSSGSRGN